MTNRRDVFAGKATRNLNDKVRKHLTYLTLTYHPEELQLELSEFHYFSWGSVGISYLPLALSSRLFWLYFGLSKKFYERKSLRNCFCKFVIVFPGVKLNSQCNFIDTNWVQDIILREAKVSSNSI